MAETLWTSQTQGSSVAFSGGGGVCLPSSFSTVDTSRHPGAPRQAQRLHFSAALSSQQHGEVELSRVLPCAQSLCRSVGSWTSRAVLPVTPPCYPKESQCTSCGSGSLLPGLYMPARLRSKAQEERGKVMAGTLKGKERPARPETQAQAGSAAGQCSHCPCDFPSLQVLHGDGPSANPPTPAPSECPVPVTTHDLDVPSIPIVAGSAKREGLFPPLPPCAPELCYERLPTMTISTFGFPLPYSGSGRAGTAA